MSDLSPAAQAVYNAVLEICPAPADEIAATVLRAVADQVVPLQTAPKEMCGAELYRITQRSRTRLDLLAIAAELEGVKYGTYHCNLKGK